MCLFSPRKCPSHLSAQVGAGIAPSLLLKNVSETEEGNQVQGSSQAVLASSSTMQGLLVSPS